MLRHLLILLCCLSEICLVAANPIVHGDPRKQAQLVEFLFKYGYLTRADPRQIGSVMSFKDLEDAVKTLQRIRGLNETGSLDDARTLAIVDEFRCGVPDFGPTDLAKRKRRYAAQGTIWKGKDLTYKMNNYPNEPSREIVDSTIKRAFAMWSKESQLKFRKVDDEKEEPQIKISFVRGYHGDDRPADGPGKELAHAFFPLDNKGLAGDLHFDNDETYTVNNQNDGAVDLLWLSLHELGHSLGLDHSYEFESVMFPFYVGYKENLVLDTDDIQGIQQLYGMPPIERLTPTPHTDPVVPVGVPDICDLQEKIDAIFTTKDGKTYVFSGSYCWEIGDFGAGEPQKIKDVWSGLPDNIDAAFTRGMGDTYFFKGSKYWIFRDLVLISGPDDTNELNLPSTLSEGMDAVLEWSGNGRTYFFKGNQYWRYSWRLRKVDYGYPKAISRAWFGVPDNLEAAQRWPTNGKTYFFKDGQYYALRKRGYPRVDSGYPKDTAIYWMGCSKEGLIRGKISPRSGSTNNLPANILVLVFSALLTYL